MASLLLLACLLVFAIPAHARFLLPQIKPGGDHDHKIEMIISTIKGREPLRPPPAPKKATPPKPGGHANPCEVVVSKASDDGDDDNNERWTVPITSLITILPDPVQTSRRVISGQAYNVLSPRMGSPAIGQLENTSRASTRPIALCMPGRPCTGDFITSI